VVREQFRSSGNEAAVVVKIKVVGLSVAIERNQKMAKCID
jgi:hypothetical protein